MADPTQRALEAKTVFVLTGLLLAAIVSISFYNLDRHPAFMAPSDDLVDEVNALSTPVVFAYDPVSLSVLEDRQSDLDAHIFPLTTWPPEGPTLSFGARRTLSDAPNMELTSSESVWSLWTTSEAGALPFFGMATVEIEDSDGQTRTCRRGVEGGHQCGNAGWTRMRHRQLTIDGERQRCIWAHPIEGKTLRFRFPEISATGPDGRRLELESALTDRSVGTGVDVDFVIHHGDTRISHRHRDRRGWQSTALDPTDEAHELIVEVSASDVGRRHICFRFSRP